MCGKQPKSQFKRNFLQSIWRHLWKLLVTITPHYDILGHTNHYKDHRLRAIHQNQLAHYRIKNGLMFPDDTVAQIPPRRAVITCDCTTHAHTASASLLQISVITAVHDGKCPCICSFGGPVVQATGRQHLRPACGDAEKACGVWVGGHDESPVRCWVVSMSDASVW